MLTVSAVKLLVLPIPYCFLKLSSASACGACSSLVSLMVATHLSHLEAEMLHNAYLHSDSSLGLARVPFGSHSVLVPE